MVVAGLQAVEARGGGASVARSGASDALVRVRAGAGASVGCGFGPEVNEGVGWLGVCRSG